MSLIDITASLTSLVADFTSEITTAAPVVLSAVVLVAGVNIGIKWVKKTCRLNRLIILQF